MTAVFGAALCKYSGWIDCFALQSYAKGMDKRSIFCTTNKKFLLLKTGKFSYFYILEIVKNCNWFLVSVLLDIYELCQTLVAEQGSRKLKTVDRCQIRYVRWLRKNCRLIFYAILANNKCQISGHIVVVQTNFTTLNTFT